MFDDPKQPTDDKDQGVGIGDDQGSAGGEAFGDLGEGMDIGVDEDMGDEEDTTKTE